MRISRERDGWRADGAVRRDWRATREGPEQSRPERVATGCAHRRLVARGVREYRTIRRSGDLEVTTVERRYELTCRRCHSTRLPVGLLLAQPTHLSDAQIGAILATHWCRDGHLYPPGRAEARAAGDRWWRFHGGWCVMCGHRGGTWTSLPTDPRLYRGAGFDEATSVRLARGRRGETTVTVRRLDEGAAT